MSGKQIPISLVLKWAGADEKKWNSLVGSLFQHVRLGPLKFTTSSILPYLKMDYIFDHKTEYTLPDIPSDRLKFKISSIVDYFEFAIPNEALSGTFDKFYLSITEDKVEIRKLAEDDLPPLTGSKRLVREAGHLGPWKKGVSRRLIPPKPWCFGGMASTLCDPASSTWISISHHQDPRSRVRRTVLEYEVVRVQVARVDAEERDRIGTEVNQGIGPYLGRDDITEIIRA